MTLRFQALGIPTGESFWARMPDRRQTLRANQEHKINPASQNSVEREMMFGSWGQSGRSNRQRASGDFSRFMEGAIEIECSRFGDYVISQA
jgi:hypothetical protein